DPPSYRTPASGAGHTRHYLPGGDHVKGETGGTSLTLDPFVAVSASEELLVRWDTDLHSAQRQTLAKLAELIPYLGRSESVCEARLADDDLVPDHTWWRPEVADGERRTRLLVPTHPLSRKILEVTPDGVRKQKRTLPPGTRWADYTAGTVADAPR